MKDVIEDQEGNIVELQMECKPVTSDSEKPKGWIHWVSEPVAVELRLYERLFKHPDPENVNEVPNGFLSDVETDSMRSLPNALADRSILTAKVYDKLQFERVGFFSVDPDTKEDQVTGENVPDLLFHAFISFLAGFQSHGFSEGGYGKELI